HPHFHENRHNPGVLANGTMPLGTHTGVDEDLSHGILGCRRLFPQIGLMHGLDEINGVIVGNKLQRISHAIDQIILTNDDHLFSLSAGWLQWKVRKETSWYGRIYRAACKLASMAREAEIKRRRVF